MASRAPLATFPALLLLLACALATLLVPALASAQEAGPRPCFELVETWPVETDLDDPQLRDAHEVWLEMIARAQRTIDLGQFYASDREGSRLEAVVVALEAAAERGVRVRFLASETFRPTYPKTLARLDAHEGILVRYLDLSQLTGGTLHAKYWVLDGREVFFGSQNFDWRALEHIVELGARVEHPAIAAAFGEVFERDWRLAGGEPDPFARPLDVAPPPVTLETSSGALVVTPVFSPPALLAHPDAWDLPALIERIGAAERRVRVQLLSYGTTDREGRYFGELESALRAAAARRVQVELLVADWSKRRFAIEGLQSLECLPNVEVRLVTIPAWSGGHIPFARVIHAKFLTIDGERGWLGTANWNRDSFLESRNVGLLLDGAGTIAQLDRFFERLWSGPYAERVDPGAKYEAPFIGGE